ncbi:hypothetical protein CEUSTIGMA_g1128.t1 [Chlamydomonas eustigma]|uniref:Uncharacterized protein n=1 Tax=Chlamydomonas eustigma TaxID=1157962 RepID=A0A250WS54_9CHLO|nr:hypothetical protein CEUSTIGMA_g1128.t1 [Chlamydomonas eustigma]|eukprot:GAX73677.1 hypothetical protein CEUSTIGMA_g1128.t1 [Chlamydomonas eustigma]
MSSANTPSRSKRPGDENQDVWIELFQTVKSLAELLDLCSQALGPDPVDKMMSVTTKKRLLIKSLQGLQQSKGDVELLTEHLKALQSASQQWQRSMMYASKSQEELMHSLESAHRELHTTSERLRSVDAQRLTFSRESEELKLQLAQAEKHIRALTAELKQRDEDVETAQFAAAEAQAEMSHMSERMQHIQAAREEATSTAERAVAALDGVKAEAAKSSASAERHQQVVAKLTADNLMFLMSLKKTEADLAAANLERGQLKLAVEHQRGPWFDEVRAGVEERVKQAMRRAESLELDVESMKDKHAEELKVLRGQLLDLEDFLGAIRAKESSLEAQLSEAVQARSRAEAEGRHSTAASAELRNQLEALSAERRVLHDNVASMRQECNKSWASEQEAQKQLSDLQGRVQDLSDALLGQEHRVKQLESQLEAASGINRQLMQRKEEVEWQLMAAMSKLENEAVGGSAPYKGARSSMPLSLAVSGTLQVDRPSNSSPVLSRVTVQAVHEGEDTAGHDSTPRHQLAILQEKQVDSKILQNPVQSSSDVQAVQAKLGETMEQEAVHQQHPVMVPSTTSLQYYLQGTASSPDKKPPSSQNPSNGGSPKAILLGTIISGSSMTAGSQQQPFLHLHTSLAQHSHPVYQLEGAASRASTSQAVTEPSAQQVAASPAHAAALYAIRAAELATPPDFTPSFRPNPSPAAGLGASASSFHDADCSRVLTAAEVQTLGTVLPATHLASDATVEAVTYGLASDEMICAEASFAQHTSGGSRDAAAGNSGDDKESASSPTASSDHGNMYGHHLHLHLPEDAAAAGQQDSSPQGALRSLPGHQLYNPLPGDSQGSIVSLIPLSSTPQKEPPQHQQLHTSSLCPAAGSGNGQHEPAAGSGNGQHEPAAGSGNGQHEPAAGSGNGQHDPAGSAHNQEGTHDKLGKAETVPHTSIGPDPVSNNNHPFSFVVAHSSHHPHHTQSIGVASGVSSGVVVVTSASSAAPQPVVVTSASSATPQPVVVTSASSAAPQPTAMVSPVTTNSYSPSRRHLSTVMQHPALTAGVLPAPADARTAVVLPAPADARTALSTFAAAASEADKAATSSRIEPLPPLPGAKSSSGQVLNDNSSTSKFATSQRLWTESWEPQQYKAHSPSRTVVGSAMMTAGASVREEDVISRRPSSSSLSRSTVAGGLRGHSSSRLDYDDLVGSLTPSKRFSAPASSIVTTAASYGNVHKTPATIT